MKTFFRFIFILLLVVVVLGGALFAWWHWGAGANKNTQSAFDIIPADAIYVVETNNLTKAWDEITTSKIWEHLSEDDYFAEIEENMDAIDGFLKDNKAVDMLLSNREMYVSTHMISSSDYDFLYIIDLQKMKKAWTVIKTALKTLDNYDFNERKFESEKIIELTDKKTKEKISICLLDNLLAISYTDKLIENVITQKATKNWNSNKRFQKVSSEINENRMFSFYFNYNMLEQFGKVYLSESNDYISLFSKSLEFTALNAYLENEQLTFEGYTILDSLPSYLKSLTACEPAAYNAYKILPDQTAFYMAFTFDNSATFFESLQSEYAYQNKSEYDEYNNNLLKITDFLKLDLKKALFSWIGNEIAVAKLRPMAQSRMEDVILAIHTNNLPEAKAGMAEIMTRVKKRTPAKFESKEYNNFTYYNLKLKGFFSLFLGKMFQDIEIPYFTYIEDYVVFSNSETALQKVIDSYVTGSLLARNKEFSEFKTEFEIKSNLMMYVNMPAMYQNLYFHSQRNTRQDLEDNKDLILSFEQYGFQLVAKDSELLSTTIVAKHNPDAAYDNLLAELELESTDALSNAEFENLAFKITPEKYELNLTDGNKQIFYPETKKLYAEGAVLNKKVYGLWRIYYENGSIMTTMNYNEKGELDGDATFFWDNTTQIPKAEILYKNDQMINIYREFYEDGDRKAEIEYKDGKADGEAKFYYKSGPLKIEGKYKNGEKTGSWKYYTEKGELISKDKFKKGKQKS